MRPPPFLLAILLIPVFLLAACSSSPSGTSPQEPAEDEPLPDSVPNVTGERVKVEWRNLRVDRRDPPLGLINSSSPEHSELYRQREAYAHVKPIPDKDMGYVLAGLKEIGYFDYANEGVKLKDLSMGDGHGVVTLTRGDEHWALIFRRGQGETQVPKVYRDTKFLIIEVHRQTLHLAPTSSQGTFQLPQNRYQPKK